MSYWCPRCAMEHLTEHVEKADHINSKLREKALPELPPQLELLRLLLTAPQYKTRTKRCRHRG